MSKAYRAVHSLQMQKIATEYLDMSTATAALEKNAKEYHERCELPFVDNREPVQAEAADEPIQTAPSVGLWDILTEDFDEDDEEDSEWEESDEDTDDEYYEYCEGSDSDSEMEALAEVSNIELAKPLERTKHAGDAQPQVLTKMPEHKTASIGATKPPTSIFKDQAMHDRITAALRNMSFPPDEPEEAPLARVETHIDHPKMDTTAYSADEPEDAPLVRGQTHIERPKTDSTAYSTDDAHSEATAVQTKSHQQTILQHSTTAPVNNTRKASVDSAVLQRKLSMRSASGLSQRLKTVCYKFAGRVMVPIRGKTN